MSVPITAIPNRKGKKGGKESKLTTSLRWSWQAAENERERKADELAFTFDVFVNTLQQRPKHQWLKAS